MTFIEEYKDNFYIKKNNLFYETKRYKHEDLFLHTKDILNKKKNIIIDSSSSDDDYDYVYDDYDYDGGAKKETKKKSKNSKGVKRSKLLVMPTFINVLKGRIIYTNQTKLELEKINPEKTKEIILGTIIDCNNIKTEIKNKNDLMNYIKTFDVLPLLFNLSNKAIINKNKKTSFFNTTSKLMFVTFKLPNAYSYYKEVIEKSPYESFKNISDVLKEKDYIIAHYIYENYYMFLNYKKHKFEINECYAIDQKHGFIKQNLSSFELINLSEKIFLDDFVEILNNTKKYLTLFN